MVVAVHRCTPQESCVGGDGVTGSPDSISDDLLPLEILNQCAPAYRGSPQCLSCSDRYYRCVAVPKRWGGVLVCCDSKGVGGTGPPGVLLSASCDPMGCFVVPLCAGTDKTAYASRVRQRRGLY